LHPIFENVTYEGGKAGYLKIPMVVMFYYSAPSEQCAVWSRLMHIIYYDVQTKEIIIYDFPA
jgi:hypothetical protein